jgi:hypothetical protein
MKRQRPRQHGTCAITNKYNKDTPTNNGCLPPPLSPHNRHAKVELHPNSICWCEPHLGHRRQAGPGQRRPLKSNEMWTTGMGSWRRQPTKRKEQRRPQASEDPDLNSRRRKDDHRHSVFWNLLRERKKKISYHRPVWVALRSHTGRSEKSGLESCHGYDISMPL